MRRVLIVSLFLPLLVLTLLQTTTFTEALGYYTYHENISIHAMGAQLWLDEVDRPIAMEQINVSEPNTQLDCSVPHCRSSLPIDVDGSSVSAKSSSSTAAAATSANADFTRQMRDYEQKWYGQRDGALPVAPITMRVKRKFGDGAIQLHVDYVRYMPDETADMSSSSTSSSGQGVSVVPVLTIPPSIEFSLAGTHNTAAAASAVTIGQPTKRCRLAHSLAVAADTPSQLLFVPSTPFGRPATAPVSTRPASVEGLIPNFPPQSVLGVEAAPPFRLHCPPSSPLPMAAAASSSAPAWSHGLELLAGATHAPDASMAVSHIAFSHNDVEYVPLIASVLKHLFNDDTLPDNIHQLIKHKIQGRRANNNQYVTLPAEATENACKHFHTLTSYNIARNTKFYQLQTVRDAFELWRKNGRGHQTQLR
jgi:hypothetical protein